MLYCATFARSPIYIILILLVPACCAYFSSNLAFSCRRYCYEKCRFRQFKSPSATTESGVTVMGSDEEEESIVVEESKEGYYNFNEKFKVLGLCGGIGSGKSSASKLLVSSCNCLKHIDADSVAHSIYTPGSQAILDVVDTFGKDILLRQDDGEEDDIAPMEIDRKKLGEIVFAERSAMAKLEAIVWPHVKTLITDEIDIQRRKWATEAKECIASNKRPIVVLEAAVLLDAGWHSLLDGVWVVTAPRDVALARLIETRGLTIEEASKRIDAQESRRGIGNLQQEVDSGLVTGEINNNDSLDALTRSLSRSLDDPKFWRRDRT